MEEKNKITGTDWTLVESMVKQVYPDVHRLLSNDDVQDIIELSKKGILITADDEAEDEEGDLDFPLMEVMTAASLGFMTIQTAISYLQWEKNRPKQVVQPSTKDRVKRMLEDEEYIKRHPIEVKNELMRQKESINAALQRFFPEETDSEEKKE